MEGEALVSARTHLGPSAAVRAEGPALHGTIGVREREGDDVEASVPLAEEPRDLMRQHRLTSPLEPQHPHGAETGRPARLPRDQPLGPRFPAQVGDERDRLGGQLVSRDDEGLLEARLARHHVRQGRLGTGACHHLGLVRQQRPEPRPDLPFDQRGRQARRELGEPRRERLDGE